MKTSGWLCVSVLGSPLLLVLFVFSHAPESGPSPRQTHQGENDGAHLAGDSRSQPGRRATRAMEGDGKERSTVRQLGMLAATNPELVSRLHLRLFDANLDPNLADWELLGLGKEDALLLAGDLQKVFAEIRIQEAGNFEVVGQSDTEVRIALPKMSADVAERLRAEIGLSFSKVFDSGLAENFSRSFIERNPTITGGLMNRDRVVTIRRTSEDVMTRLQRRYEIRTQVLYEGTAVKDAAGNLENHSQDNGIELVETIPSHWLHLIAE